MGVSASVLVNLAMKCTTQVLVRQFFYSMGAMPPYYDGSGHQWLIVKVTYVQV